MENQNDSMLVGGFYPKARNENAPDWVLGKASFNLKQFSEFVREFKAANPSEDWLNIDMKIGKSGKPYASVDTWKPDPSKVGQSSAPAPAPAPVMAPVDDDLPF